MRCGRDSRGRTAASAAAAAEATRSSGVPGTAPEEGQAGESMSPAVVPPSAANRQAIASPAPTWT
jgi:hypothetical protein